MVFHEAVGQVESVVAVEADGCAVHVHGGVCISEACSDGCVVAYEVEYCRGDVHCGECALDSCDEGHEFVTDVTVSGIVSMV